MALVRPEWQPRADDDWRCVADLEAAVEALPLQPASVFLAIGRQHLQPFAAKPQHRYVLRFIDEPQGALPLPTAEVIIARGPFNESDDLALMRSRSVTWLVTRNSGADGARAKVDAARTLGVPVIMISRPAMLEYEWVANVDAVMAWLHHECRRGA